MGIFKAMKKKGRKKIKKKEKDGRREREPT